MEDGINLNTHRNLVLLLILYTCEHTYNRYSFW